MLKWVAQNVGVGVVKVQLEEFHDGVEKLKRIGNVEMGAIMDMVTEYRILFEKKGINVSDPIPYIKTKPAILIRLEDFLQDVRKKDDLIKSMAVMVWLYTLRAAHAINNNSNSSQFEQLCKNMWKELSRGFSEETGTMEYPKGFEPS